MHLPVDPEALRRMLRAELRAARDSAELTQKQVAESLDWSESKVRRVEQGEVSVTVTDLRALLSCYNVSDPVRVDEFVKIAKAAKAPDSWARFTKSETKDALRFYRAESGSRLIKSFQIVVVPGMLQTVEYARSFLKDAHQLSEQRIEQMVEIRQIRQSVLHRQDPTTALFIIDEAALRRVVGGPDIMKEQLSYLNEMNKLPNVSIRIIPFPVGAHPGMRGPLVYMEFPERSVDPVIFLEGAEERSLRSEPDMVKAHLERFAELERIAAPAEDLELYTSTAIEKLPGRSHSVGARR